MRSISVPLLAAWLALGAACAHKVRGPEGESEAQEADDLLQRSEKEMRDFDVDDAKKHLDKVHELLKDPKLQANPDLSILWDRYNSDTGDLEIARKEKVKHELALKVAEQQKKVDAARGPLLKAAEDLEKPDVTKSNVDDARSAVKKLQDALLPGKPLEAQDKGYDEEAKHAQRLIEKSQASIDLADKRVAFITGPLASAESGLKLSAQAKAEKDKTKREPLATDARGKLAACVDGAQKALQETAALASTSVMLDGKPKKASTIGPACEVALKSTDRYLALLAKASKKHAKK